MTDLQKDFRFLTKSSFKALVNGLVGRYDVYGTVDKDGFPAYGPISKFEDLVLFEGPTHLSAKEFVFPPRETLLRFEEDPDGQEGFSHTAVAKARDQVLIGLHSCDVHGMNLMDKVFSFGTPDVNYLARRNRTLVIATGCFPDKFCFCSSLGTGRVDEGFDLFVHSISKGFLVRIGTPEGAKLLKKYARGRKATAAEIKELGREAEKRAAAFKTRLEAAAEDLPGVYGKGVTSPVWEMIGSICYGCGSCNHVCPTCYCFDVRDEMKTNLKGGERVRVWDGCTLEDFSKVAGGHNFRKTRAERLRHRFNRKFNYLTDRFDALFCIGCGRCTRTCLVDISIAEVTNELIRESNDK
jgi:formate hydrogenlyase subunit 6/NADH:ubiquinone oxidoreductase subunit I